MATALGDRLVRIEASRAAAWVRAGILALTGAMLAALGHHAVADGAVPWRFVMLVAGAQFVVIRPVVRRPFSLPSALGCTLAAQGTLHLALEIAGCPDPAGIGQVGHAAHGVGGQVSMPGGNGHAWHQGAAVMTAVHVLAAPAVAWLLHRADAAVSAALDIARAVRGIVVAAWVRLLRRRGQVRPLPAVPATARSAPPVSARARLRGHPMVRRGPPGHRRVPTRALTGRPIRLFGLPGKEHPCVRAPRCPRVGPCHRGRRRRADGRPDSGRSRLRPHGGRGRHPADPR